MPGLGDPRTSNPQRVNDNDVPTGINDQEIENDPINLQPSVTNNRHPLNGLARNYQQEPAENGPRNDTSCTYILNLNLICWIQICFLDLNIVLAFI